LLEDPFAEFILRGQIPAGSAVRVSRKDDKLDFATGPGANGTSMIATSTAEASVPPVPSA
jgi:hypothetical protein